MSSLSILSRQGHRLLQIGVALFLFTSFEGFAVPYFAAPNLGRSVHTLSAFSGVLLLTLGLLWPQLKLSAAMSRVAFWFLIYSDFSVPRSWPSLWLAYGEPAIQSCLWRQEQLMGATCRRLPSSVVAYSAGPTGIISFALILWGLRIQTPPKCE